MERFIRASAALLLVCLSFSGCAYMTKTGRQQMAYRHWVNKHVDKQVRERQRQIARLQKAELRKMKIAQKHMTLSEPKVSATVESSEPTTAFSPITATETAPPEP